MNIRPKLDRHTAIGLATVAVLVFFGARILFTTHDSFKTAQKFLRTNSEVEKFLGSVSEASLALFDMGSLKNGNATYTIDVVGNSATAKSVIRLKNFGGCWKVLSVDLTRNDGLLAKVENLPEDEKCEPLGESN